VLVLENAFVVLQRGVIGKYLEWVLGWLLVLGFWFSEPASGWVVYLALGLQHLAPGFAKNQ
jgi:hypothetical protein